MAELIVALDVPNRTAAEEKVRLLGDAVDFYKIGLELFTANTMAKTARPITITDATAITIGIQTFFLGGGDPAATP